jgi:hypothetical protein
MTTPTVNEIKDRRVALREYAERSEIAHARPVGVEPMIPSQRAMVEASVLRIADKNETRKVTVIR